MASIKFSLEFSLKNAAFSLSSTFCFPYSKIIKKNLQVFYKFRVSREEFRSKSSAISPEIAASSLFNFRSVEMLIRFSFCPNEKLYSFTNASDEAEKAVERFGNLANFKRQ